MMWCTTDNSETITIRRGGVANNRACLLINTQ